MGSCSLPPELLLPGLDEEPVEPPAAELAAPLEPPLLDEVWLCTGAEATLAAGRDATGLGVGTLRRPTGVDGSGRRRESARLVRSGMRGWLS